MSRAGEQGTGHVGVDMQRLEAGFLEHVLQQVVQLFEGGKLTLRERQHQVRFDAASIGARVKALRVRKQLVGTVVESA